MNITSIVFKIARVGLILMLFFAVKPQPYSYYEILRWFVFGISIFTVIKFYRIEKLIIKYIGLIVFSALGILFNPVFVVHLNMHGVWSIIDIIAGILFALTFLIV